MLKIRKKIKKSILELMLFQNQMKMNLQTLFLSKIRLFFFKIQNFKMEYDFLIVKLKKQ